MAHHYAPDIEAEEVNFYIAQAASSKKLRCAKVLHEKGDVFNHVFNFLLRDTYMQPHMHPGPEKIEKIHLIKGSFASIFFDNYGKIIQTRTLIAGEDDFIEIPAFTWHTYLMLTPEVVTYETMNGVYEPNTWKNFPEWAPAEGEIDALDYYKNLRAFLSQPSK